MTNFITYLQQYPLLSSAFKYVIDNNKGAYNPYHSNFHLIDVFTTSMEISNTYDVLTEKDIIEIGIATLFHDFNHSAGKMSKDSDNISLAIIGLVDFFMKNESRIKEYGIDELEIEVLIGITEYPHIRELYTIKEMIVRDSDMIQCYNRNWFLNVITGFLQREIGLTIQDSIQTQIKFIQNIEYYTEHAKYIHGREQEKILQSLYYLANIYK